MRFKDFSSDGDQVANEDLNLTNNGLNHGHDRVFPGLDGGGENQKCKKEHEKCVEHDDDAREMERILRSKFDSERAGCRVPFGVGQTARASWIDHERNSGERREKRSKVGLEVERTENPSPGSAYAGLGVKRASPVKSAVVGTVKERIT